MKKNLGMLLSITAVASMMFSSVPAFAAQLPDTIIRDGKEFVMDVSAGGGSGTATPDNISSMARSSYKVLGSDVKLYIDYSHGHGGDHFSAGWVKATAPKFYARAEVWANGRLDTSGKNTDNKGDTANATSYLATGIVENATPRIFYGWD